MKVLAVIPARGGSKRVPRKNVRMVAGRPLIEWTISQALECKSITKVVVSSEDEEILEISGKMVETIKRPANLAEDQVSSLAAVQHALTLHDADFVVLLQPTSPLRSVTDIENALYISKKHGRPCVSVTLVKGKPDIFYAIDFRGEICEPQQAIYRLNGAVYVSPVKEFKSYGDFILPATKAHNMPEERSLDIDTEEQLAAAHEALERKLYEMVM